MKRMLSIQNEQLQLILDVIGIYNSHILIQFDSIKKSVEL